MPATPYWVMAKELERHRGDEVVIAALRQAVRRDPPLFWLPALVATQSLPALVGRADHRQRRAGNFDRSSGILRRFRAEYPAANWEVLSEILLTEVTRMTEMRTWPPLTRDTWW